MSENSKTIISAIRNQQFLTEEVKNRLISKMQILERSAKGKELIEEFYNKYKKSLKTQVLAKIRFFAVEDPSLKVFKEAILRIMKKLKIKSY